MRYEKFNKQIIELVGGQDNIESITHCVTRLRFRLKNEKIAKTNDIKKLDGVIDVLSNDVAYQIIIGAHVTDVYEELMSMLDIDNSSVNKSNKGKGFKARFQGVLSAIAETINPFLDVLMAAGMVAAILAILNMLGVLSVESPTYIVFDSIKTGIFTFLPILIVVGYAKRQNVSSYLAMALAFPLVLPSINGVEGLSIFGLPLQTITYTGTFIPALLGAWLLCIIVKFLNRVVPKSLNYFLVPGLSLVITLPVVLIFFGPIGNIIGAGMNAVIEFLMNSVGNWVAIAFYSALHPFLLMTGAGSFVIPITLNFISTLGYDPVLLPGGLVADFAICGAVVGCLIRARKELKKNRTEEKEREVELFGVTSFSALMGVTEPALFGVFPKYRYPFIATLVGSSIGGLIAGLAGVKTYGFVWGITSIPTYLTGGKANFVWIIISVVVAFTLSAIVSWGLGFPKDTNNKNVDSDKKVKKSTSNAIKKVNIGNVAKGKIVELSSVSDQVFASEALGKGIAIIPEDEITSIFSPVSGKVTTVFPTKHAYGIETDEGVEVLIHIGVDTVNLEGKYFENSVKQGQYIKYGDVLGKFDAKKVKEEGFDTTIIIVITNTKNFLDVIPAGESSQELLYVLLG